DYPVIMAINLIAAVMILASNLIADLLYAVIDPRIKYA
ncbi:MAG: ABC transporter permease, partial [Chloroflexota bacterium]|nr:ABC transporter permease [Chloroflexota bacterium]